MIEIEERDFIDLLLLVLKTKDAVLLDFYLDLIKDGALDSKYLDDKWHDADIVGDDMLKLEAILYERGLLK